MGTIRSVSMPNNILSESPVIADYLYPDDQQRDLLTDFELGGIALNDPSQGLDLQRWTLAYIGTDVTVTPDSGGSTVLFSFGGITEISLAFDQNMRPFVSYILNGRAWYWWYDPLIPGQEHFQMEIDVDNPRCCLDEKRSRQAAVSDIILAYQRADSLYFRMQRDRYTVEYDLGHNTALKLNRVGMSVNNRLRFEFKG